MSAPLIALPLSPTPPDWAVLAATTLPDGEKIFLTGRFDLAEHLRKLEQEFCGDPLLHYYHAAISVLIRRDIQRDLALQQFEGMWRAAPECLMQLSLRWLISACDTLMEHAPNLADRTAGAMGSFLGNAVKLYETERRFSAAPSALDAEAAVAPVSLFDGLTSFSVGYGDMIFNQRQRFAELAREGSFAHRIVAEIISRLDANDTVFRRLARHHKRDASRW
ncbi:MAG: hypothetical protein R3C30_00950 [Hyphomonadaceae bacterium]